ncbi:hypothetical protein AncyloWKF20_17585 [Ancylobacter sp. WKF20]|uniref:hypothetical protein n=1 Tax=Ancylobacter sp. WKF20 TaxID=3039801 RepID=UPI0024345DB5|nr:hypothetical protein [Ancylobacter sp. WKF20]WGD29561.1 hypothetical protein AncyloWKF20_17585 [Ancylobacter sp. WKF20]
MTDDIRPLLGRATPAQAQAVLGAMRAVAESGGALSASDRLALDSAALYMFGLPACDAAGLAPVQPEALAGALAGNTLAADAVRLLTAMAFVDGTLDPAKITAVLTYARALDLSAPYLDEIREAAAGHVQEALADMARRNMESLTGKPWSGAIAPWLLPYEGAGADPALAARFAALAESDPASFGHAFWRHFTENGYAFPGAPSALNAVFSVPHDTNHVLTGFDTSPRGEVLTSTFTAAMHPHYPMAGHILPAIFSWHLRLEINAVAGGASGGMDPVVFWRAWAAGAAATVDTFAPGWDFWSVVDVPLAELRVRYGLPARGVEIG